MELAVQASRQRLRQWHAVTGVFDFNLSRYCLRATLLTCNRVGLREGIDTNVCLEDNCETAQGEGQARMHGSSKQRLCRE